MCGTAVLLPIAADRSGATPHHWAYRGAPRDAAVTHGCGACDWQGTRRPYVDEAVRSAHELALLLRPDAVLDGQASDHLDAAARYLRDWAGASVELLDAAAEDHGSGAPGVVVEVTGAGVELSYPFTLGEFWATVEFLVDLERLGGRHLVALP